ncbi:MAG: succinate dehydrogenase, cytochrome b556 subunit [Anaerolineae bacterium]|nr:succinate dehydrogenase, cytochrome b556 subunit [Anaerolineae bacterium]
MTSLVTTVTETLRYRGAIGQWSWVLHRVSGLGVVLFFVLHVIDTSWAVFYPEKYVEAIASYQSPLFTIGEFFLVAAVVYHAINGLRIIFFDYRPHLWRYQQRAAIYVLIITVVILIPVFILMFGHVLNFYNSNPQILGLGEVIAAQLPFLGGMAAALIVAILFSVIYGLIAGDTSTKSVGERNSGSPIERFWWSFMRISGLLIVPLVFGHLTIMHVLQGVFDITAAGSTVVGTGGVINETGTAVEFIANRWNLLIAGVAIWRFYDFALLALVAAHGFNGLRYVLTDYTMSSPVLRRAMVYLCVIAATVLLTLGLGALIGTIDSGAIEMAQEAAANLHP